jgi:hypothetical protein
MWDFLSNTRKENMSCRTPLVHGGVHPYQIRVVRISLRIHDTSLSTYCQSEKKYPGKPDPSGREAFSHFGLSLIRVYWRRLGERGEDDGSRAFDHPRFTQGIGDAGRGARQNDGCLSSQEAQSVRRSVINITAPAQGRYSWIGTKYRPMATPREGKQIALEFEM